MTASYVSYYWAPFLLSALLTVGVLAALLLMVRRSAVFGAVP